MYLPMPPPTESAPGTKRVNQNGVFEMLGIGGFFFGCLASGKLARVRYGPVLRRHEYGNVDCRPVQGA